MVGDLSEEGWSERHPNKRDGIHQVTKGVLGQNTGGMGEMGGRYLRGMFEGESWGRGTGTKVLLSSLFTADDKPWPAMAMDDYLPLR